MLPEHEPRWKVIGRILVVVLIGLSIAGVVAWTDGAAGASAAQGQANGRRIFRYDTFGDEQFWTDTLHLERVIQQAVDPTTALGVGLKVDMDALPPALVRSIQEGKVDLKSPATTLALLKLEAVVGVKGQVRSAGGKDSLVRVGITCALCHSTVDDAFSKGIGHRKDGWPNRDLNVGAIIALSPAVTRAQKAVYTSWGPGKYDPRYNIDGKSTPLVLPPAYGLARVANETYTAEGPISYWNAYVAVTQMHGRGNFADPRLNIRVAQSPDLVTSKLPALRRYQHSLPTPPAAAHSVDRVAAARGRTVFAASCASCHANGSGTDNNRGVLHEPSETGMDAAYAQRTAQKRYRTKPLRGLGQHAPYFHDGSAATLADVVSHYDRVRKLGLSAQQKADLAAYLRTL